jgi:hypothetical protein
MIERESVAAAARRLLTMLEERTRRPATNVVALPIATMFERKTLDLSSSREIKR